MKIIDQTYEINATVSDVWNALTDPKIIDEWGGGPAEMKAEKGFDFKLWGGDIHGKNIEVVPEKLLVQEWVSGEWDKPSIAKFELSEKDGITKIHLIHSDVPEEEFDDIADGWKSYYLGEIKNYLENR
jgi:activator of HSP90 ATPase